MKIKAQICRQASPIPYPYTCMKITAQIRRQASFRTLPLDLYENQSVDSKIWFHQSKKLLDICMKIGAQILRQESPRLLPLGLYLSTNLRSDFHTHIQDCFALMKPYLRIYTTIFRDVDKQKSRKQKSRKVKKQKSRTVEKW